MHLNGHQLSVLIAHACLSLSQVGSRSCDGVISSYKALQLPSRPVVTAPPQPEAGATLLPRPGNLPTPAHAPAPAAQRGPGLILKKDTKAKSRAEEGSLGCKRNRNAPCKFFILVSALWGFCIMARLCICADLAICTDISGSMIVGPKRSLRAIDNLLARYSSSF